MIPMSEVIQALRDRRKALEDISVPQVYNDEAEILGRAIAGLQHMQEYERRRVYLWDGERERKKWM